MFILKILFYKYQGAGNDFIIIDNRTTFFKNNTKLIAHLCNRRFGIGADGLILLENDLQPMIDFKMVYFNSDGNESTLCGNGGRCIVAFAKQVGIIDDECTFSAIDGVHQAYFENGLVSLSMPTITHIHTYHPEAYFLDTGSPHHVEFVHHAEAVDVKLKGAEIRYSPRYKEAGSNVNFVEAQDNFLKIRTYERGVEDETLACGTGVTAAAIAAHYASKLTTNEVHVQAVGGDLKVRFQVENEQYQKIELIGPAEYVYKGEIQCEV